MPMPRKVLVIEDNRDIAHLIALHLSDLGIAVDQAYRGDDGLLKAINDRYDLIILDLMLPGMDGIEICRQLRSKEYYVPILMLTAKSSELDRVLGLEIGADDYLTKPFSVRELIARVKAIFRRVDAMGEADSDQQKGDIIQVGELALDNEKRKVKKQGREVELTAKEFDLLWHFATHPGRVYTRTQLLDLIWGYGHEGYEHTVNSHINRLRAKIEENPSKPDYILTVWGVGYKFADIDAEMIA
jgi:DNA-binding response OmpR family regulator